MSVNKSERLVFTKSDILNAMDRVIEWVPYPESGNAEAGVYVCSIPASERSEIENDAAHFKEAKDGDFARTFTVRMAALGICDEDGVRLFKETEINLLMQKNAAFVTRCSEVVQRLSGFSKGDVEAMKRNLKKAQADASPSA